MNNINDSLRLANMLAKSRVNAKKSQEYMSLGLGVAKNTIINWEKGTSSPSIKQTFEWFKLIGQNPLRPFLEFLYPNVFENIQPSSDDIKIQEAIQNFIKGMPIESQRQLAYLFFGEHGSSPFSVLEMITAHLHTDMQSRVVAARTIADNYDMCRAKDEIINPSNILPNMELLNKSIELGKNAVINKMYGYTSNKIGSE